MKNVYIERIKSMLLDFQKSASSISREMKANNEKYIDPVTENTRLKKELDSSMQKFTEDLKALYNDEIRSALSLASVDFSPESQSAEISYLNGQIPRNLSPEELDVLIDMHPTNISWLRSIHDFATQSKERQNFYSGQLKRIHLPKEICQTYARIFTSAHSIANDIYTDASAGAAVEDKVSGFMTEPFSSPLYDVIGTGDNLNGYKNKAMTMPEKATHLFDSIELKLQGSSNLHSNSMPSGFEGYKTV